jgi:stage V sporulation protein G
MEITEVKVFPVNEDKLKAYVTIIFDNCFVVRDLKIINGNTGLFVAMPSKKRKDGTFRDIAHPLNSELRASIEKKILQVYEEELKKMSSAAAENMKALGQKKRAYDDEGP